MAKPLMQITFSLEGDKELRQALESLGKNVQGRISNKVLNAAARPVELAWGLEAPEESGLLKRAVGVKPKSYRKSGSKIRVIGARRGIEGTYRGYRRAPFYYSHLVHGGTKRHALPYKRISPTQVIYFPWWHPGAKKNEFFRRAWDKSAPMARALFIGTMRKEVSLAVALARRRALRAERRASRAARR